MPRYFIEVAYKGTHYSGFQIQENAPTVQLQLERAMSVLWKGTFQLTGSSRTDAGVHARQNFFHFDSNIPLYNKQLYNLNAILPSDIVVRNLYLVADDMHSRFSATARTYRYYTHSRKNPFLNDTSWFYPFTLQYQLLHEAAAIVLEQSNFIAFSKKNSQVNNYHCTIQSSFWEKRDNDTLVYCITANRFLRGMVRALVSTMLQVGRGAISLGDFRALFDSQQIAIANFSSPAHGLFLEAVHYPMPLVPVIFEAL